MRGTISFAEKYPELISEWHPIEFWGGENIFVKVQEHDKIKLKKCKEKEMKYERILNIIKEKLKCTNV